MPNFCPFNSIDPPFSLDRLLQLLDTGASPAIRQAAAKQVAQIATKCLRTDSGIEGGVHEIKPILNNNGEPTLPQERSEDWAEVISTVAKVRRTPASLLLQTND